MKLEVSGKDYEHFGDSTLVALLKEMGADQERVAVMVNGSVVKRLDIMAVTLHDGDSVEVLMLAAGGQAHQGL